MKLQKIITKYVKFPFLRKTYNIEYFEEEVENLKKSFDVVIINKRGEFFTDSNLKIIIITPIGHRFNDIDNEES